MTRKAVYDENPDDAVQYTSRWKNNNDEKAEFSLMLHEKNNGNGRKVVCQGTKWRRVILQPGQTIDLPSEFDNAIRQIDKSGIVVGGLCPWLTKIGETEVQLHKALDYKSAILDEDLKQTAEQLDKEDKLRRAVEHMDSRKKAVL